MKLIIFDLDGTLINSIEDLGTAVNHALATKGLQQREMPEYYMMVGNGVRKLVQRAMPEELSGDAVLLDELLGIFMEYYSSHIDVHTRPYPGMQELLSRLASRGYSLGVASNKFQSGADALVRKFFPDIDFVEVLGNGPDAPLKPSPEVVFRIMAKASGASVGHASDHALEQGNVVLVGDSQTDIQTAANAGIPSIAVTWGFRPAETLTDATCLAGNAAELEERIEAILTGHRGGQRM